MASQTPLPPGCSPPIGYASGSAAEAGRIVFIADLARPSRGDRA